MNHDCTTAAEFVTALAAANPGDTLTLTAGNTFDTTTGFLLTNRGATASNPITIRTSQHATLPNRRIHPGDAARMPLIRSTSVNGRAIETSGADADGWVLVGLNVTATASQSSGLIILGDASESVAANQPNGITLDRCYIHGAAGIDMVRGVAMHVTNMTVRRCWISDFWQIGTGDNQALWTSNGPGPYIIEDNFLSSVGETVATGGADPGVSGLIPADFVFRYNTFSTPQAKNPNSPAYDGTGYTMKNVYESKVGRRMLFEFNLFENAWVDGQNGTGFLLSVRNQDGALTSATIEDVTFRYNIIRKCNIGIRLFTKDGPEQVSDYMKRITITHNWITETAAPETAPSSSAMLMIIGGGQLGSYHGGDSITVEHNTFDAYTATATPVVIDNGGVADAGAKHSNFVYRNNVVRYDAANGIGIKMGGQLEGTATLDAAFSSYTVANNLFFDGTTSQAYPANTWSEAANSGVGFASYAAGDLRLTAAGSGGDYRAGGNRQATDGTDLGANVALVKRHVLCRHGLGQGW